MKKIVTLFLCCLGSTGLWAQQDWTLQQCLSYAKENSISVLQAIHNYETAQQNVIAAKAAFAPTISASTSQNFGYSGMLTDNGQASYGANYGINLGMTLFNGGKLSYNKKQTIFW